MEVVDFHRVSLASILQQIINETNLISCAEYMLSLYRSFYSYSPLVRRYSFEKGIELDIKVERIYKLKHYDMLKFCFLNSDVLMRPYTVELYFSRHDNRHDTKTIGKTKEENESIIYRLQSGCFSKKVLLRK
ncbi:MAG: hypothetical protein EBX37_14015 [Alphaproteobacteria bacterium]|nr:hypothetical protein [Alphaproteobacteria bacterium]